MGYDAKLFNLVTLPLRNAFCATQYAHICTYEHKKGSQEKHLPHIEKLDN